MSQSTESPEENRVQIRMDRLEQAVRRVAETVDDLERSARASIDSLSQSFDIMSKGASERIDSLEANLDLIQRQLVSSDQEDLEGIGKRIQEQTSNAMKNYQEGIDKGLDYAFEIIQSELSLWIDVANLVPHTSPSGHDVSLVLRSLAERLRRAQEGLVQENWAMGPRIWRPFQGAQDDPQEDDQGGGD